MRVGPLVFFCLVSVACTPPARRTWRASDHSQPPEVTGSAPTGTGPEASPAELRLRIGGALYTANCASCHGAGGRGDGPAAPPSLRLPDFTDPAFHDARSEQDLDEAIRLGRGAMPPFGDRFDMDGRIALVARIRAFGGRTVAPATAPH